MSDDGNESDADIAEETPPMPAPDAEGDEGDGGTSAGGSGGRKKRRSGTVARAPSKAQTKMVHSCIVKVSLFGFMFLWFGEWSFFAYLLHMYLASDVRLKPARESKAAKPPIIIYLQQPYHKSFIN